MGLLSVSGITAGYTAADEILKELDFAVDDGEIVCIIGPNGAGKSTLLKAIAGLVAPSRGAIALRGRSLAGLPPREITRLGVAYVPQEHNIFPTMSVRENLEIGGYVDAARTPDGQSQLFLADWNHAAALAALKEAPPRKSRESRDTQGQ